MHRAQALANFGNTLNITAYHSFCVLCPAGTPSCRELLMREDLQQLWSVCSVLTEKNNMANAKSISAFLLMCILAVMSLATRIQVSAGANRCIDS